MWDLYHYVGCWVLVLGHHCRVGMFSCHLIPIVMVVQPGELVPDGCWCSLLLTLAASTHDPPCKQWLTGLGVGAGLSIIIVGSWGGCWAVPCHCGTPGAWFHQRRVVIQCCCWAWGVFFQGPFLQHIYNLKLMKTVSWFEETRNIKLT